MMLQKMGSRKREFFYIKALLWLSVDFLKSMGAHRHIAGEISVNS